MPQLLSSTETEIEMKNSYITATDQFCGAGGTSEGLVAAGVEVKMALNHWELAIETHNTNHPNTDHDCTDVQACDPRRYPSTTILTTSPECTNHSLAKGKKRRNRGQLNLFGNAAVDPAAERSRATMWDVPRFAEFHDYEIIIVENVVDVRYWRLYNAWLQAMHDLGYRHKCSYLNSMFFPPCPQSRDRIYIVFWKKGNKAPDLEFRPMAPCHACGDKEAYQWWKNSQKKWGKYGKNGQYLYRCSSCNEVVTPYYYAAFNAIDWSIPGKRIGDRKKPLAEKTMQRIQYGLDTYHDPFMLSLDQSSIEAKYRVKSSLSALYTQTTVANTGFVVPFVVEMNRTGKARGVEEYLSTILAGGNHHMLVGNYSPGWVRPLDKTLGTITTSDHHGLLTAPFIVENRGQSKSKPISEPLGTFTSMTTTGVIMPDSLNAFLTYYYSGSKMASGILEPIKTITATDRASLTRPAPSIQDCHYRMLKPHEVQAGMAFRGDYIILGNAKEQVKQLGNAVTPPLMAWISQQCVNSLT